VNGAALAARPLNNASVLAERFYLTGLEAFDRVLAAHKGAVRAAVADVAAKVAGGGDPWTAVAGGLGR
jgi:hypothetical protein